MPVERSLTVDRQSEKKKKKREKEGERKKKAAERHRSESFARVIFVPFEDRAPVKFHFYALARCFVKTNRYFAAVQSNNLHFN